MFEIWGCEENYLARYLDTLHNIKFDNEKTEAFFLMPLDSGEEESILSIDGENATIQIKGILSQNGPPRILKLFGIEGTSYKSIIAAAMEVGGNEKVKNVRLVMDTPGGEVKGVDAVWSAIRDLAKEKTVIAENHGMVASGGYWIASAANKIVATTPVDETGSIGVVAVQIDFSKAQEEAGIKEITILSRNAPNKRADATTKEGYAVIQDRVDSIERVFISRISEGRGISEETIAKSFGRGALMVAQDPAGNKPDALSVKMIDGVLNASAQGENNYEAGEKPETQIQIDKDTKKTENEDKKKKAASEVLKMKKLEELISDHPEIAAEIETIKADAKAEGSAEIQKRIDAASPIIGSAEYPEPIKSLAVDVLKGKQSADALAGAVAVYDATKAQDSTEEAQEETEQAGDTPAQQGDSDGPADGVIENESDYQAMIAKHNAAREGK